ncbi:putative satD protein [Hyphomonas neptunium ATCC 15444]|uniref:Putative satD protein n=2 Tax=Hyphomonas TaxID=85 RepID=Q0BX07_HYPNA|nr:MULTISPECIES: SatD family protein [Hyphomonas]ABI75922.1 putative satD protein [Hyphomonas neptunium ATCC 15444]KCZ92014.1 putative satD protein [Hyphomonas hirschiana VP5]
MLPPDQACLLLCDIKDSSSLGPERAAAILAQIDAQLAELNSRHSDQIILPFEISYGDEFAGLVQAPATAFEIVRSIRREIAGQVSFRFAAVHGRIGARSGNIRQVGGEVFTLANAAIARLKRQNRFGEWHIYHDARDSELSLLTNLCQGFIGRMSAYQFQVYSLLADGLSQKVVAEQLGKYPQSVSDAVRRAEIDLVIEAERQILEQLKTYTQPNTIASEKSIESR